MPVITEDDIRSLAAVRSDGPIVSCYLDVDGRRYVRPADYERSLAQLIRGARDNGRARDAVKDLKRIEDWVRDGFDRSKVRGLAVFSGMAEDLWRVVELPVPVRNQLVVNDAPAVGQLEAVMQDAATVGLLLVDKAHTRVFVFHLDEVIEHVEAEDYLGRDYDNIGQTDRGDKEHHREEFVHQHLRHAADLIWSAYQSYKFDHVAVAVADHLTNELYDNLHPYLRERLHGRIDLDPTSPEPVVRDAALSLAADIERKREARLVGEFIAALDAGRGAVAGLKDVLGALSDHRIERLLVSNGYEATGWLCPECRRFATVGPTCSSCGADLDHLEDVVEVAIDSALNQSCRVDVCTANADLDVRGRIGAMLRY